MNTLILKPIISEKSMNLAATGTYMFEVPKSSNKLLVGDAVAKAFGVEVTDVRISVLKGKVKRFRNIKGKRSDVKRAYVTLKAGQKISVFEENK